MDKASTIHIVSEIAVLSVMFVYFDRRLKTIESNVEYIKKNYMHAFEDIYKKLELLKQGILTTQSMSQMSNMSNQSSPTISKSSISPVTQQTKIGKLERIERNENIENIENIEKTKEQDIEQKEIDVPQIQKRAFTTLISELSFLSPLEQKDKPKDSAKVEIIDEADNESSENKESDITENDMNEIEKLIEGKED